MVKTRSGDGTFDKLDDEMPVKVLQTETAADPAEDEEATASSQPHESSEEKDLTYMPGWGRQSKSLSSRYRRPMRNSVLKGIHSRSLRSHYTEDDMEESRDDMMSDESDIFPRQCTRRGQRESLRRTRMSSHHHPRHVSRSLHIRESLDAQVNGDKDPPEGSVRRSTRTRKQKYDSYNNTWIDGMNGHHSLRGYPSMFPDEKKPPSEEVDADRDVKPDDVPQEKVYVYNSDPKEASEEEEEETVRPRKRARTIAQLNTTAETLESGNDLDMDMYSRVKRMHRPTKRYMFDDDKGAAQADVDQTSQTSTDEGSEQEAKVMRRTYSLRKTKPAVDRFQANMDPPRRGMRSMLRRRETRFGRSRSSSSSSSEDERFEPRHKSGHAKGNKSLSNKSALAKSRCLPTPINQSCPGETASKPTASNLADVDPMSLDRSIMFAHVGGLEEHIRCLKEMVVFPMLYPEVFDRFHIQPAKGVLFHGLPGTGKTLLARALANECSQGARKVAFFMRKGADCLTKWVGESERQLRLLFDQAYQMRPSIIFFDEIDGLAPVRSSKQDQIHASIVSTLLALMDGLDSRGEVIVIGATNRVDAIDPALRRPGRFDRELYFPLPARQERLEILKIHVSEWEAPPPAELLSSLAGDAAGYCGSDLRALCSEAVLRGLRRRYPQIYASSRKLLLDPQQVTVEGEDFVRARMSIVPAASRGCPGATRNHLPAALRPLLGVALESARGLLDESFLPQDSSAAPAALVRWPRLLVSGDGGGHGQAQVTSALLGVYEHVAVHTLDLTALFRSSACSPEEACIQVFNEARRNPPSVVLAAGVDRLWSLSSDTLRAVFLSKLRELDPAAAVLLLATADCVHDDLPADLAALFSPYRNEVVTLSPPGAEAREAFFRPVFLELPTLPPPPAAPSDSAPLEELPLAPPPPPPKLTEEQLRQTLEREEATLRELRIFLRDCCSKLARNRLFFMFTKPVDIEEVPDYLTIIAQPMDLETIMSKIDLHRYACAQEFLDDIDLVVRNALDYNPDRTGEDKLIRHRACCLRDTAYALIKAEMDTDYEHKCRQISASRRQRADSPSRSVPDFIRARPAVTFAPDPVAHAARAGAADADATAGAAKASSAPATPAAAAVPPRDPSSKSPLPNGVQKRPWLSRGGRTARRAYKSSWSRGSIAKPKAVKRAVQPVVLTPDRDGSAHASEPAVANGIESELHAGTEAEMATAVAAAAPTCNGDGPDGDAAPADETPAKKACVPRDSPAEAAVAAEKLPSPQASPIAEPIASAKIRSSPDEPPMEMDVSPSSPDRTTSIGAADASFETLTAVAVDRSALAALLSRAVRVTDACDVETLLDVRARLVKHVAAFSRRHDRLALTQLLSDELDRFENLMSA